MSNAAKSFDIQAINQFERSTNYFNSSTKLFLNPYIELNFKYFNKTVLFVCIINL